MLFNWLRSFFVTEPPAPEIQPIDPAQRILNGKAAERLLTDPMLNAVFDSVAAKYRASWEQAARGDLETQRVAHLSLSALKDVQGALRAHLNNAKLLEADLAAHQAREERKLAY